MNIPRDIFEENVWHPIIPYYIIFTQSYLKGPKSKTNI